MKFCTPQIVWHDKDPVYSIDFHHVEGEEWRLASGGTDKDIKIWKVIYQDGKIKLEFLAHLSRHTRPVNTVRFSPNGKLLATASDDAIVCIWKKSQLEAQHIFGEVEKNQENWSTVRTLRSHLEDIYDLSWSPDSNLLVTCSIDESVIFWDVEKGSKVKILHDSKQPTQGLAWDPLGEHVAMLSLDRNLRIYSASSLKLLYSTCKLNLPNGVLGNSSLKPSSRVFHDENMQSFFRRIAFSPDGSFLITPSGRLECTDGKHINTTYIFLRQQYSKPIVVLPASDKPTVAVKCCPVIFKLRELPSSVVPLVKLPYSIVFAVASFNSVYIYSTQQSTPIGYLSNIHYASLTDIAWSRDGQTLVVSSSDGYCTFLLFSPGELGTPLSQDELRPDAVKSVQVSAGDGRVAETGNRPSGDNRNGSKGGRKENDSGEGEQVDMATTSNHEGPLNLMQLGTTQPNSIDTEQGNVTMDTSNEVKSHTQSSCCTVLQEEIAEPMDGVVKPLEVSKEGGVVGNPLEVSKEGGVVGNPLEVSKEGGVVGNPLEVSKEGGVVGNPLEVSKEGGVVGKPLEDSKEGGVAKPRRVQFVTLSTFNTTSLSTTGSEHKSPSSIVELD